MASSTIVSSVSHVPFRRFLPHEKTQTKVVIHPDYHEEFAEDEVVQPDSQALHSILSDEDIGVLMEARLEAGNGDWHNPEEQADTLYLPFTFSLAARN